MFELVFGNPETEHFARFDKHLRFDAYSHAVLYLQMMPRPQETCVWYILFGTELEISKMPNCIDFDALINEVKGITQYGKNWERLLVDDNERLYRPYTASHDCYGTEKHAERHFNELDYFRSGVKPKGLSWVIKPYAETSDDVTIKHVAQFVQEITHE